ncbi:MAG: hypothetical protein ABSE84_10055 [Isosphaeraceae bacterium]|jgi:hypothetical protein
MTQTWTVTVRRKELSEHTLELVVEAPTPTAARKAALAAALKANAGDLGWQLYDYDWAPGEPPTVDSHAKANDDDVPDFVVDGEGNLVDGGAPKSRPSGATGFRIVTSDEEE